MSNILNKLVFRRTAKKMVALAQKEYEKGNAMMYFVILNGLGRAELVLFPGDDHDYKLIIDAIHEYQAKHPKKKVKEGYYEAISTSITLIDGRQGIVWVLNYLAYEYEKQRDGTSAFTLDYKALIAQLKAVVAERIDKFRAKDSNFDMWFHRCMEEIEEPDRRAR